MYICIYIYIYIYTHTHTQIRDREREIDMICRDLGLDELLRRGGGRNGCGLRGRGGELSQDPRGGVGVPHAARLKKVAHDRVKG